MNMANTFLVSPAEVRKRDRVERISALHLTPEEFIEKYEKVYKPVVLTDLQKDWSAGEKWTLPASEAHFSRILIFRLKVLASLFNFAPIRLFDGVYISHIQICFSKQPRSMNHWNN
jgi:hypothetical protein